MKLSYRKKILIFSVLLSLILLNVGKSYAYTLHTNRPANVLRYQAYSGFSTLSKQHFNHAMYEWNAATGKNFLQVVGEHSLSNFPSRDGVSRIYKQAKGTDYVARNSRMPGDQKFFFESDVNINSTYNWANSAQPDCYDTNSVFLHEMGHSTCVDHAITKDAVMYKYVYPNREFRYLRPDDLNAAAAVKNGIPG